MPIHIIEKNIGETCLECANRYYSKQKKTYIGRLDPMARGKLLILTGDDTKKRNYYLGSSKTYQFTIIGGIKTDSDDILGEIIQSESKSFQIQKIIDTLDKYPKKFKQEYHPYSSFVPQEKINKKRYPLWYWTKNNLKPFLIPSKDVEIKNRKLIDCKLIDKKSLKRIINERINQVTDSGDFRKEELIKQWKNYKFFNTFQIKYQITVSSGFYIRTLINRLSMKLNYPLMLIDLYRTEIIDQSF